MHISPRLGPQIKYNYRVFLLRTTACKVGINEKVLMAIDPGEKLQEDCN